jgi:proteic killer suppression protein
MLSSWRVAIHFWRFGAGILHGCRVIVQTWIPLIVTYGDERTRGLHRGDSLKAIRRFDPRLRERIGRKLDMIDAAERLIDLQVPPGNRLEQLAGDLKGFHSIRVNRQWRIIFRWSNGMAYQVQCVDYHP